jgi:hypothetical protein
MDRRELITTGLTAAGLVALPGLAGAQTTQSSELPPASGSLGNELPTDDPAYGYGPPPPQAGPPDEPLPPGEPIPPTDPRRGGGPRRGPAPEPSTESYPYDRDAGPGGKPPSPNPTVNARPSYPAQTEDQAYDRAEIVNSVSNFMGVPAEAAARVVEKIFRENGRPTAYIAGEEASGAIAVGLRYGKGLLYMKGMQPAQVYWRGPSVGWDFGGNASRSFTLVYNLHYPDMIFRRFPGVEGSAYFIGGLGVNYQRAEDITLAPIRAGVGLRLGANVGYLAYSKRKHIIPF